MGKCKCPSCKKFTLVLEYDDCVFCGGGDYYYCENCDIYFDLNKKEL